ncbi:MAG: hypothetical protein Q6J18_03655 [Gloeomargarita sp. DG02_3_bins_56]
MNTGGALDPQTFWQQRPWGWSHRGEVNVYPASIVKLFYLVAAHEWLERGLHPYNHHSQRRIAIEFWMRSPGVRSQTGRDYC